MTEEQVRHFEESPVEYSREMLWVAFFATFSTGDSNLGDVRLERITDEDRVSTTQKVRSVYQIAGKKQEIVWGWEHGAWRIADASFENALAALPAAGAPAAPAAAPAAAAAPHPAGAPVGGDLTQRAAFAPRKRGYSITGRLAMSFLGASRDNFNAELDDTSSLGYAVDVAVPLGERLSVVTGLGYQPLGASYYLSGDAATINEDVQVLQVPVMVQLGFTKAGAGGAVRLTLRAGAALDVAVDRGGTFETSTGYGSLSDPSLNWYEKHNEVNVAALFGGGLEFGLGPAPAFYFGVDVTSERHLLAEWTDDAFTGGANYRYTALRLGIFLRYQSLR